MVGHHRPPAKHRHPTLLKPQPQHPQRSLANALGHKGGHRAAQAEQRTLKQPQRQMQRKPAKDHHDKHRQPQRDQHPAGRAETDGGRFTFG